VTETLPDAPPTPALPPCERVAQWEPILRDNGWKVQTSHTDQRARLEASHLSGAAVMVTAGLAGRAVKGRVNLYVLPANSRHWLCVKAGGAQSFATTQTVSGYRRWVETKCSCRTGAGRRKVRYATERRANDALLNTRIERELNDGRRAECRAYRCPDDDRVWHLSSRPSWRDAPGDSALWASPNRAEEGR
jgi:hypothetical protein